MPTLRLYQTDRYLRENTARVTAVTESGGFDSIACDASVFYPLGGGQPSDTGTVALGDIVYRVTAASDRSLESDVWHQTDAPAGTFHEGDEVTLTIDWDVRFRNMQRHLGEHMLSGVMYNLFNGTNKGFHMGEEFITIDIDLGGRMLTDEELLLAERTVNEAVWADLPVTVSCFDDYESSLALPVRKQVPHEGKVFVVTVGDPGDPLDCIACCGTHPKSSAEVGLVAIYKCDPNKGMNRVYFDCGRMAKDRLSSDSRLLAEVAKRYSCSSKDLLSRLDTEAENTAALRARLAMMSSYVRDAECAKILSEIDVADSNVYTYSSDILSNDDLLKLGFSVIGETEGKVLLMMQPESLTCIMFSSGDVKCGQYIKEHAKEHGGRGGGRDDNARAIFQSAHDMRAFATEAAKVLQ
ncbi:MAG: alanyl-tRNA editing protein [Mogibacterium sp.]|nr:alanyl-tRNA editing protein [Mogibacterium sp.]